MNIGAELRMGFNAIGRTIAEHPRIATAVGLGALGIGALALTACTSQQPAKEGTTFASDTFGDYDSNRDGSIGLDESRRGWGQDRSVSYQQRIDPYYVRVYSNHYHDSWQMSVDKIVRAAGGNDAVASWQEIGDFAVRTYDAADRKGVKDGVLDAREQQQFLREYGADRVDYRSDYTGTTYTDVWSPEYTNPDPGPVYVPSEPRDPDPGPVYDPSEPNGSDPGPVYNPGGSGNSTDPGNSDDGPVYGDTGGNSGGYNPGGTGSSDDDNGPVYTTTG